MPGRKPLPTKFKMLKGEAQKCRVNPNEPELALALPEPPGFLSETAREEWLRKAPVLANPKNRHTVKRALFVLRQPVQAAS